MSKSSSAKRASNDPSKYIVAHQTKIAEAVSGRKKNPIVLGVKPKPGEGQTWEMLQEISDEIANSIAAMAITINETVEMVRLVGCEHPQEFKILVTKTNEDLVKFSNDFAKVKAQHEGRTGHVKDENETALCFSIFENYMQFRAHFDGTMHHTQIAFTEYALEARDRGSAIIAAKSKQIQEDQNKAEQSAEEPSKS